MRAAIFIKRSLAAPAIVFAFFVSASLGSTARGAEVTRVVSALDDDNRFDFNLSVQWLHQLETGYVKRELQSDFSPQTEIIKDLTYRRQRDVLNFRADFGILWDVGLHVSAPLVLADSTNLDFDRSEGTSCIYADPMNPPQMRPTCVNEFNSTILQDGILPGYGQTAWGLDARHNRQFMNPTGMVNPPGPAGVFRSPKRTGFENLGIGITWAAFNQARDDTKPTWTLSFDALLDVFKDMGFDPLNPTANTAVGKGYHQLIWSTWVSKRFRHFDPYFGAWYAMPIRTNNSLFRSYSPAQTGANPQQQAGVAFGVEQVAWENVPARQRVTVEARAHLTEYFFGRNYSPIWQPLSGSAKCNGSDPSACRPGIDLDLNGDGNLDAPFPGVTDTESFASLGGDLGLNIQVGPYIRFRGLFGLAAMAPHFITAANAGKDANRDGRVDSTDRNEANPVYKESIDLPGRRFRVEGTKLWTLFLEGSLMF